MMENSLRPSADSRRIVKDERRYLAVDSQGAQGFLY